MHEYSIISDLVLLAEENARLKNATKIHKIIIEVGVRSAVEVELLQSAFDVFKGESEICSDSTLEIRKVEVELLCKKCNAVFKAEGLEYGICIYCKSSEVEIVRGLELDLVRLEME